METWQIALWICGGYLLVTLAMGILPGLRVSKSIAGYVAADRSMNFVVMYFDARRVDLLLLRLPRRPGLGLLPGCGGVLHHRLRRDRYCAALLFRPPGAAGWGRSFGFVTQAELLAHRFESRTLSDAALGPLSVAVFIPYLVLQMKGAGIILSTISEGRVSPGRGRRRRHLWHRDDLRGVDLGRARGGLDEYVPRACS